jgi:tetratricopeptide (TPR) repeat protein
MSNKTHRRKKMMRTHRISPPALLFVFLLAQTAAMAAPLDISPARAGAGNQAARETAVAKEKTANIPVNGRRLEQRTDLSSTVAAYRRAADRSPRSAEAHCALGKALVKAGRHQSALLSFTVAIRLAPDHPTALYERALLCLRIRLFGQAAKDLGRLIELRPGVADYHYQRARALLELHRIRDAFRDFLRAHELDRTYPKPTLHEEDSFLPSKVVRHFSPTNGPPFA